MKQIGIFLLLIFGLVIFLSCEIDSSYVDAVSVKMDADDAPSDKDPADEDPDDDPAAASGVAMVGNFTATALSYTPSGDTGVIRLSWDAPVASADQAEATDIVIRQLEANFPTGISSGTEVYNGAASATQADYNSVQLNDYPHFGIWTKDAEGNLSAGQFDNVSIKSNELTISIDGFTDSYGFGTPTTSFNDSFLRLGGSIYAPQYRVYLKFNSITVSNILYADLRLSSSGSKSNITIGRLLSTWNSGTTYNDLEAISVFSLGTSFAFSSSGYNSFDVTSAANEWVNNGNDNGLKLYTGASDWSNITIDSVTGSNEPKLDIYYADYN